MDDQVPPDPVGSLLLPDVQPHLIALDECQYVNCLVLSALRGAIALIELEHYESAGDLLRLARDRMEQAAER
jgi:hypothetical protein